MVLDRNEVRSALSDLVETCKESELGYRVAAESVKAPEIRSLFVNYELERAQFAVELNAEAAQIGGDATKSGSNAMHHGWVDLKSAVAGNHDHAILEEAERAEDAVEKNYREALKKDLPASVRSVVGKQYREIARDHVRVRTLRDESRKAELPLAGLV